MVQRKEVSKVYGVPYRNTVEVIMNDMPEWRDGVATVPVRIRHSELDYRFAGETAMVSWKCPRSEAVNPDIRWSNRFVLRDDDYFREPFPSVLDALAEPVARGQVPQGFANLLQALVPVMEAFTRKHFPQGPDTPAVPGYRNSPLKPRNKTSEVNIILRQDMYRRSSRHDIIVDLTPAKEPTLI